LLLDARKDAEELVLSDGNGFTEASIVRVTLGSGDTYYHALAANTNSPAARLIEVDRALEHAHVAGAAVVEREPILEVQALDAGRWGNRLRISIADERSSLVSSTIYDVIDRTHILLKSSVGVEAGTVFTLSDPATDAVVGDPIKVDDIDRTDYTITLAAPGLSWAQWAAAEAAEPIGGLRVRSHEFYLTVSLLSQPDPAQPFRNNKIIDQEPYQHLSMDPRHSGYVETIIGAIDGDLRRPDQRPEGTSRYIRVRDLAPDQATAHSIRLGPEILADQLPQGESSTALLPLAGGDDSIASLRDAHYVGRDAVDPEDRTGLHSLHNIEEVSIVAVPGQVSVEVQSALINHCEQDRYRFAVLDGPIPPRDTIADVLLQRQQFDTKYAALYYPWLIALDSGLVIPPSGHVMGVYARTDVDRGVHKAPANEVVSQIRELTRTLNKGQHDILNPYPVNINVIRDFRPDNRGIRVWGGRVITSDPDWKYVNVRRLLIFIEASIDRGLQWVVFEPNAEPLWARVRRTISNFLTVVWRNGALEGTVAEQAFYVKCDRTTMTQTDIDNGRLICEVGVAPVKPAEYVIIRIGLWTAFAED
jgi:phage tail sheath protein FI